MAKLSTLANFRANVLTLWGYCLTAGRETSCPGCCGKKGPLEEVTSVGDSTLAGRGYPEQRGPASWLVASRQQSWSCSLDILPPA